MELYEFSMQFRDRWNREVFDAVLGYVRNSRPGRVPCYGSLGDSLFFELWDEEPGMKDLGKLLGGVFGANFFDIEIKLSPYRIVRRKPEI